jgi:adenylate kinase family enzyme
MYKRIHILGASGSGTTTLGSALAKHLQYHHFDSDVYYWFPTDPPFQTKRDIEQRRKLLLNDLSNHESWVLSGSLCNWGDVAIPLFELAVYLWLPADIRLNRLRDREERYFGMDKISPGGQLYLKYKEFMEWAAKYDEGDESIRSRKLHEKWLKELRCKVIRIETDLSIDDKLNIILKETDQKNVKNYE